jgi:hypothetical protein
MNDRPSKSERVQELLADQSIFGLEDEEKDELKRLIADSPVDVESFERIASIASLAILKKSNDPLPNDLKQHILDSFSRTVPAAETTALRQVKTASAFSSASNKHPANHARMNRREMAAWLVAAGSVAGLIIDRRSLWSILRPRMTPEGACELLLRSESDIVQAVCQITDDPSARGVTGNVVWSTAKQRGFLRVKGLPKNEPFVHQYQFWIFDSKQDERYPIDGGTFDIESKELTTVVPINPKLPVVKPTMFAVTIEKRGGVVVSNRQRLLLVGELI